MGRTHSVDSHMVSDVIVHWKPIINDLSERDSQLVHVHGVDSTGVIVIGDHDLVKSLWMLCECADCGHDPAIADVLLVDVLRRD